MVIMRVDPGFRDLVERQRKRLGRKLGKPIRSQRAVTKIFSQNPEVFDNIRLREEFRTNDKRTK